MKPQTIVIETVHDIQKAIAEFMPNCVSCDPVVSTMMTTQDESGRSLTYKVDAPTAGSSHRDLLIEGFTILKKRMDALERNQAKIAETGIKPISVDGHMWLDTLIENRLGGTRDGLRIKWSLKSGVFYFDPFTGKLTTAC